MESTRTICVAAAPWLGQTRVHEILGAVTTLIFLATVAVVLRFIARGIQAAPYGWDDWLILFALVRPAPRTIPPSRADGSRSVTTPSLRSNI